VMDRLKLSRIDEDLESSEVASLCFLCRDVLARKRLEGINNARDLFLRLEENGLLENNSFLFELLQTIRRTDLLNLLESDSSPPEEADANPILSDYRVMLYRVDQDITRENLSMMKFLLSSQLGKRQMEMCNTALDVFAEMEKTGSLSPTSLHEVHAAVKQFDQQLALTIQRYIDNRGTVYLCFGSSDEGMNICSDAEPNTKPSSPDDHTEYYALIHKPRGLCVVINNEDFLGTQMKNRKGTQEDEKALCSLFSRLGFTMLVHNNLTAGAMKQELQKLGARNFVNDDALVVCVLSHGEMECVFGTDEQRVNITDLTRPFTSEGAPTLAGKPKLFFIQACQGTRYQGGSLPHPSLPGQEEGVPQSPLEEDAGPIKGETVPWEADFLLGMATVPQCKSFRSTTTGSIYIQEVCTQLKKSAESSANDDILTVLTRVNREVSKGKYLNSKQMPQPKYTLTKKLVLKYV
uniref:Caspase-8 n=1 Tax=Gasterosteus aculeatus aculeatus TaxID=481459 RepID=G3PH89_GASAC